jgi:hypothetical protein
MKKSRKIKLSNSIFSSIYERLGTQLTNKLASKLLQILQISPGVNLKILSILITNISRQLFNINNPTVIHVNNNKSIFHISHESKIIPHV